VFKTSKGRGAPGEEKNVWQAPRRMGQGEHTTTSVLRGHDIRSGEGSDNQELFEGKRRSTVGVKGGGKNGCETARKTGKVKRKGFNRGPLRN